MDLLLIVTMLFVLLIVLYNMRQDKKYIAMMEETIWEIGYMTAEEEVSKEMVDAINENRSFNIEAVSEQREKKKEEWLELLAKGKR